MFILIRLKSDLNLEKYKKKKYRVKYICYRIFKTVLSKELRQTMDVGYISLSTIIHLLHFKKKANKNLTNILITMHTIK